MKKESKLRVKVDGSADSLKRFAREVNHEISRGWRVTGVSVDDRMPASGNYLDVALKRKIPELDLLRQIEQGEVDVPLPNLPATKPGKLFSFPPQHSFRENLASPVVSVGSDVMRATAEDVPDPPVLLLGEDPDSLAE